MPLQDEITAEAERSLIARAATGSTEALATLFERHADQVQHTAYRLTLSADDAEDVVQDVFVGLPEALGSFSGSGSFAAWLRSVTVRTTLMRLRASRRRESAATGLDAAAPTGSADHTLDRMAIETALAALPRDLRIVFVLREVEGYTHREIARLLGIRAGTSEVRLHRARRRLRELLEDT